MNETEGKFVKNGFFSVPPDLKLNGTLSLSGPNSVLHLWSDDLFEVTLPGENTITGVLDNQKKVSLIGCVGTGRSKFRGQSGVAQHYRFFPHYVIVGNRHFSHSEKIISKISIVVDDAPVMFHDRFSFGTNIVKPSDLGTLSSMDLFDNRPFKEGSVVAYYTGKEEIFSADTVIGRISARNQIAINMGGPEGAHISNQTFIDLNFSQPVDVAEMNQRIQKVLRFFSVIAGRLQNLLEVKIIDIDQHLPTSSDVYINMQPSRDAETQNRDPDFRDILIDAVVEPRKFEELISAWLKRDESWRIARARFSTAWGKQKNYDPDRVVAAANMFDHLPKEALPGPENMPLPIELGQAVQEALERFEGLSPSPEKESVLNALSRVKNIQTLKQKIRYRSRFLTNVIYIPEINCVTDAAVDLRNFYVHGSGSRRKKEKLPEFQIFLTDTLEFVFCASDLVELGWDIGSWWREPKGAGHPFCNYLRSYQDELSKLKRRLKI